MILVTGATGTNGRLVVQALLAAGMRVRATVQDSTRAADLHQAGAELARANFDEPATLDAALAGVERCLCSRPSINDSWSARPDSWSAPSRSASSTL